MDFVDCVKKIIKDVGVKNISQPSFFALLLDHGAFDDEPRSSKIILKYWKDKGVLERISNMSSKDNQWKNDVSDIIFQTAKDGFDRDVVSDLLHRLLLGMGCVKPTFDWNEEFQDVPTNKEHEEVERKDKEKAKDDFERKCAANEEPERKARGKKQTRTQIKQNSQSKKQRKKQSSQNSQTQSLRKKQAKKNTKSKEMPAILQLVIFYILLPLGALLAIYNWDTLKNITKSSIGGWFGRGSHSESVLDAPGETFTVNGVSFKMVAVEGGTFEMGSETGDEDEKPVHSETVGTFMIGESEVTQALWEAVMENNPSKYKGKERPVHNVSWYDCQTFIKRLNQLTGKNFRLPTEAEWEYAAKGGHKSKGIYKYSGSQKAMYVAWYGIRPHEVKRKQPNELGVYDMSGNVDEWCEDPYKSDKWRWHKDERNNDYGPLEDGRVLRGGSYSKDKHSCTVSQRDGENPDNVYRTHGFRLVLSVETIDDEGEMGSAAAKDIDGNIYNTVQIGDQVWMAENLRTTRYADGTEIPIIDIDSISKSLVSPYRYVPILNASDEQGTYYMARYGYLYNWEAVMHSAKSSNSNPSKVQGICPDGWHVPSEKEWRQLTKYMSVNSEYSHTGYLPTRSGYFVRMLAATWGWEKSDHRCDPGYNPSTNNVTGFSALPTGFLKVDFLSHSKADFKDHGRTAAFWSATEDALSSNSAYSMRLYYNSDHASIDGTCDKVSYLSVRCVHD